MKIVDLRARPEFYDVVADRVWRAWWEPAGHPYSAVSAALLEVMNGDAIPFALVALDDAVFLGSTLGIACDLAERSEYTPWVAAVWVEPEHRSKKVGRSLVRAAIDQCFKHGFEKAYLCSSPGRMSFYTEIGWTPIEHGVGSHNQTVYVCTKEGFRPSLDSDDSGGEDTTG